MDPGRWRDLPNKHCSGVNPLTREREFFAAKTCLKHRENSASVSMATSCYITLNSNEHFFDNLAMGFTSTILPLGFCGSHGSISLKM